MDNEISNYLADYLGSIKGLSLLTIWILICVALIVILKLTKLNIAELWVLVSRFIIKGIGRGVSKKEQQFHRDKKIGKINDKYKRAKFYRFLNDLIIDLDIKKTGCSPYEFLFLTAVCTGVSSVLFSWLIFRNPFIAVILFGPLMVGVLCVMYTKANIAHEKRIEDVIEAQNIVSGNIKNGVTAAVRTCISVIPIDVREYFQNYLNDIDYENYHVKTALLKLNMELGKISDDFIKKCIVLETAEEHGIVGMFNDVIEINNTNMELRREMKRKFEKFTHEFIISAAMIIIFLIGTVIIFPNVRDFYFNNFIGQMIIVADLLLMISEFVFITYLRAQEL